MQRSPILPGARSVRLWLATRELSRSLDHRLGVIALDVVTAVIDSDMARGREFGRNLILKPRGRCARGGRFSNRSACTGKDDGGDAASVGACVHFLARGCRVVDLPAHDHSLSGAGRRLGAKAALPASSGYGGPKRRRSNGATSKRGCRPPTSCAISSAVTAASVNPRC